MDENIMSQFTIVYLEQGTREWLEWRHKGIGASEAPAIMGENPWKSSDALLREKRGPVRDSFKNEAMARGSQLEPEARRRYIARTGNEVSPACLQSKRHIWLRASVDGISTNGATIVEIKCGESCYRHTSQNRCVPDYYYGQLQHIMAVSGHKSLDFWCYLPGKPEVLLKIARDDKYIERLVAAEKAFWNKTQKSRSTKVHESRVIDKASHGHKRGRTKEELHANEHDLTAPSITAMLLDRTMPSDDKPMSTRKRNKWMIALGVIFMLPAIAVFLLGGRLTTAGWALLAAGGYIIYRQVIVPNKK